MLSVWIKNLTISDTVYATSRAGINSAGRLASGISKKLNTPPRVRDVVFIGILLVAIQILDGLLTGIGVAHFGTRMEANPLIRTLMEHWGHVAALIFVKTCAIVIVAILCRLALKVTWLSYALQCVVVLYLTVAIIPWTAILLFRAI